MSARSNVRNRVAKAGVAVATTTSTPPGSNVMRLGPLHGPVLASGPAYEGSGVQPGLVIRYRGLTDSRVTPRSHRLTASCLPIRSHSRGQRRTQVTNRQPQALHHTGRLSMAWKGARAPNLGPIWAQSPRLGITDACLIGGGYFIHARFGPTERSPPIWGSKSHEFLSYPLPP